MLLLRLFPLFMLVVLPNETKYAVNLGSTEVNHNRVALPDNGGIETRNRTVTFLQGHLIVRLQYHMKAFIVRSYVTLFYQAKELIWTLLKVSVRSPPDHGHGRASYDVVLFQDADSPCWRTGFAPDELRLSARDGVGVA